MKSEVEVGTWLKPWEVHQGDSVELLHKIAPESVALSIWSPPYHVGKNYEVGQTFADWQRMLREVIQAHYRILRPGSFCVINIADILCFADESMPKVQAETISKRRIELSGEEILEAIATLGTTKRQVLAEHFKVSEQTIDRRLNGNNIRGGKYQTQTRIKTVSGMIEEMALGAGLYLYDRRIWAKDPAWANSKWASSSFRAVDEFEYLFLIWKPGITTVDRNRIDKNEWGEWGSRAIWNIPSVRANNDHEAKFPLELPSRIIRLLSDKGDVVLDPFAGSGTTQVAAIQLGRVPIGIELNPQSCVLSNKAMKQAIALGAQAQIF